MFNLSGNAFLDLRIDFFRGQKAQYYDGSDTESWIVPVTSALGIDDITVKAQPRESTTDLLLLNLEWLLRFNTHTYPSIEPSKIFLTPLLWHSSPDHRVLFL